MGRFTVPIMLVAIAISFVVHLFGIMNIYPLYITAPLLFISIFLFILYMNNRNQFKGFK